MKHIFIPFTVFLSIVGCGIMSNPKEEGQPIHVPQIVTIQIPAVLKNDSNKTEVMKKPQKAQWYQ